MAGKIDEMHPRFLEDLGDAVINKIGRKRWRRLKYFFIAIPFLIFIIAFSYVPLLGWVYAFCDYKIGQPWNTFNWVGLKHFQRFFTDSSVFRVLRNTLVMSLLQILVLPLPAVFAIMFNDIRSLKAKKLIQTATTLPYFISWIIVFGLAQGFFSANGLVNQLIKLFGGTPSPFGLIGDLDATWIFQLCLSVSEYTSSTQPSNLRF